MEKLHFEIVIDAPVQTVWKNIIEDKPYREWTSGFAPSSYFEGSWEKGSKIRFMCVTETGESMGMFSEIAENKLYEYISIKHLGFIKNGVEDTESEEVKKWAPAYENYTFKEIDGKTKLEVDQDIEESYVKMFNEMWPVALQKLKEISEK